MWRCPHGGQKCSLAGWPLENSGYCESRTEESFCTGTSSEWVSEVKWGGDCCRCTPPLCCVCARTKSRRVSHSVTYSRPGKRQQAKATGARDREKRTKAKLGLNYNLQRFPCTFSLRRLLFIIHVGRLNWKMWRYRYICIAVQQQRHVG